MFGRKNPEVLVAGAGPVGLLAALVLARRGVRVEIIDRAWRSGAHSYALALHPHSLGLLEELGLAQTILQEGHPIRSIGFYDGATRRAEIRAAGEGRPAGLAVVLRQDAFESLLENALALRGVKVRWNHELAGLESGAESALVTVHRLVKQTVGYAVAHTEWTVGRTAEFAAPFVIGADGHRSTVRRRLGLDFHSLGESQRFAVFECRTDADLSHEVKIVFAGGTTNVLWPMRDGLCRWSFELADPAATEPARTKDRVAVDLGTARYPMLSREALEKLLGERAPWFSAKVEEIKWRIAVRFDRRLASAFGDRRVWLTGDAGHTTSPVGMQSMNVGLREACELAGLMADELRKDRSSDSLKEYGEKRLAEWRRLLALENAFQPDAGADRWVAEHSHLILPCLPGSGQELVEMAGQLNLTAR